MFTACFGFLSTGSGGGGGSQTLAQTLANGNATDDIAITSNSGTGIAEIYDSYVSMAFETGSFLSQFYGDDVNAFMAYTDGVDNGEVTINASGTLISHTQLIDLACSAVRLSLLTASRILATDSNKDIQALDTTTYPDLTELSYVKGVTSGIQTQLDSKAGYEMQTGQLGAFAPVDSTSYYFGNPVASSTQTAVADRANFYFPADGVIKRIDLYVANGGTLGSGETSSVYFTLNNTTDTLITSSLVTNAGGSVVFKYSVTVSITVTTSDYFEIRWETPAWATNPGSIKMNAIIYID